MAEKIMYNDPALASGVDPLGQFVGTGKQAVEGGGTLFSGDRDPITGQRQERFSQGRGNTLPFGLGDSPKISDGTQDQQEAVTNMKKDVEDTKAQIKEPESSLDNQFADIQSQIANINSTTKAELDAIKSAGEEAGGAFDPLIARAKEEKRLGMPKEIIRAGERGGFMSTQFAGQAALLPTAGGTFIGAGGSLERQKSAYDKQIDALQIQQHRAIKSAESAARKAIETGKREDIKMSQDMLQIARQINNDKLAAQQQKDNLAFKTQQEATDLYYKDLAEAREGRSETRQETTAIFNIVKDLPEGEVIRIGDQEFTGIKKEEIDPFFTGSNIVSLMKSLPAGTTQSIVDPNTGNEMEIMGLATEDPTIKTIQSTDDRGNVTITSYRLTPEGGAEIINQAQAGGVGKTKTQAANVTMQIRKETGALVSSISDTLEADRGADGKVNPETYGRKQTDFVRGGGGSATDYKRLFPPEEYLSIENPQSLQFLQEPKDILKAEEDEITNPFAIEADVEL